MNFCYYESKFKIYFFFRWGGGAARVSEFIYYESKFKIKKIFFFFFFLGGGGV